MNAAGSPAIQIRWRRVPLPLLLLQSHVASLQSSELVRACRCWGLRGRLIAQICSKWPRAWRGRRHCETAGQNSWSMAGNRTGVGGGAAGAAAAAAVAEAGGVVGQARGAAVYQGALHQRRAVGPGQRQRRRRALVPHQVRDHVLRQSVQWAPYVVGPPWLSSCIAGATMALLRVDACIG